MTFFHRIVAAMAFLSYIYMIVSNNVVFSSFSFLGNSAKGEGVVYILPLISMLCLAFPESMTFSTSVSLISGLTIFNRRPI